MLSESERTFLASRRVAHLATVDAAGAPLVVPVCFALADDTAYVTIDDKPKRTPAGSLKRLRNIAGNPAVALVADRYDDADWSRLGWVMLRGCADVLRSGPEHAEAQRLLRARYPQMRSMALERHPVIALRIERVTGWGALHLDECGGPP